jgi:hypothetical protein
MPIPATLLISDVRGYLDDDQFDESAILTAGNNWQNYMYNDTHARAMESSDTMTASAGDTDVEFPDDFSRLIDMYYPGLGNGRGYSLGNYELSYEEFRRRFPGYAGYSSGQPLEWTFFGTGIRLSRPLSDDLSMPLDYLRIPNQVSKEADEFDIPVTHRELLALGTYARIQEINEDYAEAQTTRGNLAPLYTVFKTREGRSGAKVGGKVVIPLNRRRSSGAWD